mgnify:CR=1 FL=1
MAPQVPYSGSPTVSLQENPTPTEHFDTPVAAFGGATAAAEQNLGSSISGAGNELFARAQAMQDLYNHSQAIEADTKYMETVGEIHAKLGAMQGKDAVDYFTNGFIPDLQKARQQIRDTLPNDMTQKLFDQSSLNTFGRTVYNGAGHAATANKSYSIGVSAARVQGTRNAALANFDDDDAFNSALNQTESDVRMQYGPGGKGESPEAVNAAIYQAKSNLWYDRIAGLARTEPFKAAKLLDKASSDGDIAGDDLGKVTKIVRDAQYTVGARQTAATVMSGADLSYGAKPVSISSAKSAIGGYESHDNYQSLGPVVPGRGQALGRYQIMPENLPGWLKEAGLPPMTQSQFLNSASAQDKVFETVFGRYMQETGSFNDAASKWFSGRTQAEAGNANDGYHTVPQYLAGTNRILARGASLEDQVARGRQMADAQSPNDPLLGDYTEAQIIASHNRHLAAVRDDQYTTRQTVEGALVGGQNGKLPTTVDELKQMGPDVENAWVKLQPSDQRRYMNILARNAKGDSTWTDDRLKEYQQLKGMAQSDPASFLDKDVTSLDLPLSARKELVNLQIAKKANAEADPRVTHALQLLRPMTDSAGLSRAKDPQGFDRFVGALQGALEQHANDTKAPAKAKDIMEIGQRLMQTQAGTGWFGSNVGANALYNVEVPDEERKKILADPFWTQRHITPTDDQIHRIYVQQLYNQLYGAKPKAQNP